MLKAIAKRWIPLLTPFKPALEGIFQAEARLAAWWASSAHNRLRVAQWALAPQPEHFDHTIDLYWTWRESRNSLWIERGTFGSLDLRGGDVLELCCGDGFNSRNFYSLRSRRVVACDFDPLAIQTAQRKNSAPNVEYLLADIRTNMPTGTYENIVWDAAIEHFTPEETDKILRDIRARLAPGGILTGYTIVERASKVKMLSHHEYEFKNKEDLLRFFTPHFERAMVFETIYESRHNLYFFASDGPLPFDPEWLHAVRKEDAVVQHR
jgi:SAM-dependent methyltransferase